MTEAKAKRPLILYPSLWKMSPAGIATTRPVAANRDMSNPARVPERSKVFIKIGKTGGTLNWFSGVETDAHRRANKMSHFVPDDLFERISDRFFQGMQHDAV